LPTSYLTRFSKIIRHGIRHQGGLANLVAKTAKILVKDGWAGIRLRTQHLETVGIYTQISYDEWVEANEMEPDDLVPLDHTLKLSIICPVYNPNIAFLRAAIESVLNQTYSRWEMILVDDVSDFDPKASIADLLNDSRIHFYRQKERGNISDATNYGIRAATGDILTFMDQDDLLSCRAFAYLADSFTSDEQIQFVYSDEDKLDFSGQRCDPFFKPDWNYYYLLSCNYICHLTAFRHSLLQKIGPLNSEFDGAQDYDLILRASEHVSAAEIRHIPRILYHWRKTPQSTSHDIMAKPYAIKAGQTALQQHIERSGLKAKVSNVNVVRYQVAFALPEPEPLVSIIIPTRNHLNLLQNCIESLSASDYRHFEIIVVDNGTNEPHCLDYLKQLQHSGTASIIKDDRAFNFSRLMNLACKSAQGSYLCFLNNDVEVINNNWLSEMVSVMAQPNVGIVGAKLFYPDKTIQHSGIILGIGGIAGHGHKNFDGESHGYGDRLICRQEISAVTGACMLTSADIFKSVGGFNEEDLPVAFNDVDYCMKVRQRGYKVLWTPFAELIHHESKSRGLEDTEQKQARFRSEIAYMQEQWADSLYTDPYYNPNLTLQTEGFELAAKSRV
jgi:GT2 family glycosyltransferase